MRKRAGSSPVTRIIMSIKFKNAYIVNKDFNILKSYDLVVEKNRIKSISPSTSIDDDKHERVIECNHNFLIPGFKNAHAHNAMVFARSLTDDVPLDKWLNELIFPLEALLTEEDVYYFTILGIMENLTSGITACADMYKFYYCNSLSLYCTLCFLKKLWIQNSKLARFFAEGWAFDCRWKICAGVRFYKR